MVGGAHRQRSKAGGAKPSNNGQYWARLCDPSQHRPTGARLYGQLADCRPVVPVVVSF